MWVIILPLGLQVLGIKEVIILHRFGSTGLVAGYIKQLLSSFNLLKLPIYTEKHAAYFAEHGVESPYLLESFPDKEQLFPSDLEVTTELTSNDKTILQVDGQIQVNSTNMNPYLKDGRIQYYLGGYYNKYQEYVPGKWQSTPFDFDLPSGGSWTVVNRDSEILNLTKKFQIKNNVYDTYTHEYLGEYLRFLRDHDDLNLMSLYNCFSNNSSVKFKISDFILSDPQVTNVDPQVLNVDTTDNNYKVYAIPVKLFNNYTIAIDSAYPVEMFCGFYSTNFFVDADKKFLKLTYKRYGNMQFSNPVLYTGLTDLAVDYAKRSFKETELAEHREARQLLTDISPYLSELKLFIKLPSLVESSIVILEGDYRNWNDLTFNKKSGTPISWQRNKTVLDNAAIFSGVPFNLIAPLQLLRFNTGTHTPFSDRLLEYLLDNCITGSENEARENVLMVQTLAGQRHKGLVASSTYYSLPKCKVVCQTVAGVADYYWEFNNVLLEQPISVKGSWLENYLAAGGVLPLEVQPVVAVKIDSETQASVSWWKYKDTYITPLSNYNVTYKVSPEALRYDFINGVWSDALQKIFYNNQQYRATNAEFTDCLGYVDKDVEKNFVAFTTSKKGTTKKTMLNFNTWEDIKE